MGNEDFEAEGVYSKDDEGEIEDDDTWKLVAEEEFPGPAPSSLTLMSLVTHSIWPEKPRALGP